jgi:hypothetical protein
MYMYIPELQSKHSHSVIASTTFFNITMLHIFPTSWFCEILLILRKKAIIFLNLINICVSVQAIHYRSEAVS